MKRPFETIGFSYLFAQIIALFCSVKLNYILLVTFISLFTVSLFFKKLRKALIGVKFPNITIIYNKTW